MRSFILAIGLIAPALAAPGNFRRSGQLPKLPSLGALDDLMGDSKPPPTSSINAAKSAAPSAEVKPSASAEAEKSFDFAGKEEKKAVASSSASPEPSASFEGASFAKHVEEPVSSASSAAPSASASAKPEAKGSILDDLMKMGKEPEKPKESTIPAPPSPKKREAQLPGLGALGSLTGDKSKDGKKGGPVQGLPVGKRQLGGLPGLGDLGGLGGLGGLGSATNGLTGGDDKDDKASATKTPIEDPNKKAASSAKALASSHPSLEPLIQPGPPRPMQMPGAPSSFVGPPPAGPVPSGSGI